DVVLRNWRVFLHDFLQRFLANPAAVSFEAFLALTLADVAIGKTIDQIGNLFRRDRAHRQRVGARILLPLAAEHDLKVWNGVAVDISAVAVEPDVRDVVLAAGIEAATDLE